MILKITKDLVYYDTKTTEFCSALGAVFTTITAEFGISKCEFSALSGLGDRSGRVLIGFENISLTELCYISRKLKIDMVKLTALIDWAQYNTKVTEHSVLSIINDRDSNNTAIDCDIDYVEILNQLKGEIFIYGLKLSKVATNIDISNSALFKYLNDQRSMPLGIAYKICDEIDVPFCVVVKRVLFRLSYKKELAKFLGRKQYLENLLGIFEDNIPYQDNNHSQNGKKKTKGKAKEREEKNTEKDEKNL